MSRITDAIRSTGDVFISAVESIDNQVIRLRAELTAEREQHELTKATLAEQDSNYLTMVKRNAEISAKLAAANRICALNQDIAAQANRRASAAEERIAELSAALEKHGDHCHDCGSRRPFSPRDGEPECDCGWGQLKAITSAILAADRKAQRRKGAAWAREYIAVAFEGWNDRTVPGVVRSLASEMEAAIERGKVEVPSE